MMGEELLLAITTMILEKCFMLLMQEVASKYSFYILIYMNSYVFLI